MRKNQKWIFVINTGNGMIVHVEGKSESVAACAQYFVVQLGLGQNSAPAAIFQP